MDIWFSQMDTDNVKTSIRVDKQLFSAQSEYQRIDVFQSQEFGKMIVLDGEIIFSEADEFIYNEMVVHVPMAVHSDVKKVLIIATVGGFLKKFEMGNVRILQELGYEVHYAANMQNQIYRFDPAELEAAYPNANWYILYNPPFGNVLNVTIEQEGEGLLWESFANVDGDERHWVHYTYEKWDNPRLWSQQEPSPDKPDEVIGKQWYAYRVSDPNPYLVCVKRERGKTT